MTENPKGLKDYLKILKRRKFQFILPFIIILSSSVVLALRLPPLYRSTAMILVEAQGIPRDLVRTIVTGFADQRIHIIKQRVMSRASLLKIIDQYGLYKDMRKKKTTEEVLEKMAKAMDLKVINAAGTDQATGRPANATIAFTLSFDGENPSLTQKVNNELTSLFLGENLKIRKRNVQETTAFLEQEAVKLFNRIEEIEHQIVALKGKSSNALPELLQFNMQRLEQVNRDLGETDRQIRSLKDREALLESQLTAINPHLSVVPGSGEIIPNSVDRLRFLRSQYVSMSAHRSPDHPDLVQIRREIMALEGVVDEPGDAIALEERLFDERSRFQDLLKKYGEDHPDVISSKRIMAALSAEIKKQSKSPEAPGTLENKPNNPAYITIEAQLAITKSDRKTLTELKEALKRQKTEYVSRIEASPAVEKAYSSLYRERENLVVKYREIKAKLLEAEVAEGLETQRKGERFSLIQPATLPEKPVKPNRPAILFIGFVFSLAAGFGCSAGAETLDGKIYDAGNLETITGTFPLGVIPLILNADDRLRQIRQRRSLVVGILGFVILIIVAVHHLFYPLDVFLLAALRRLST